jgi:dihydrolipoamide dehydrogenase
MDPRHLIVAGGGPAGYVAALHASALGARVTLVDAGGLGGTCLQRGCIPTKTLVSACSLLEKMRAAARFGIELPGAVVAHWDRLLAATRGVVDGMTRGIGGLLASRRVEVIRGQARLIDHRSVYVAGHGTLSGDFLLFATGSRPARPRAFAFDGLRVATSDDLLRWDTLPQSIAIVGEGVIACEFAFILDALGVEVTMVGMEPRPAPGLDADISAVLAREMRKKGIRFLGGATVESVAPGAEGVEVGRRGAAPVRAERVLVCVGRVPNTESLGFEATGVAAGARGEIVVDRFMRSCIAGIYAAGDVNGRVMLAHAASAQARIAVEHMLGHAPAPFDDATVPLAVFTAPEVGCIGLTEQAARARGFDVRCGSFDTRGLGKAQATGELTGLTKVVADAATGRVLGVHIVGAHATELVHEAVAALQHGASVADLVATVRAHPTLAEGLSEAAEDVFGQATHAPSNRSSANTMKLSSEILFHRQHLWVRPLDGGEALVGVSVHAAVQLGEVAFVDAPEPGFEMRQGVACGAIESGKVVSDLIAPVCGTVLACRADAADVNRDPEGEGWILRLRLARPEQLAGLLSAEQYRFAIGEAR